MWSGSISVWSDESKFKHRYLEKNLFVFFKLLHWKRMTNNAAETNTTLHPLLNTRAHLLFGNLKGYDAVIAFSVSSCIYHIVCASGDPAEELHEPQESLQMRIPLPAVCRSSPLVPSLPGPWRGRDVASETETLLGSRRGGATEPIQAFINR